MSKNEILRKKLEGNSIIKVGGAFDAMSAKLVESSGFDAVWAGSFAISAVHALPDASILTMTEFFDVASNMSSTCEIPIIADCDTGYGGPSNVHHMVRKYEKAGISSICIEDKTFPKQNSLLENGKNDLLSEKEFVAKILAAKEARSNKNFIIMLKSRFKKRKKLDLSRIQSSIYRVFSMDSTIEFFREESRRKNSMA